MLGIIGAMEVEVKELREMMENPQAQTVAGMTFYQGKITYFNEKEYSILDARMAQMRKIRGK